MGRVGQGLAFTQNTEISLAQSQKAFAPRGQDRIKHKTPLGIFIFIKNFRILD